MEIHSLLIPTCSPRNDYINQTTSPPFKKEKEKGQQQQLVPWWRLVWFPEAIHKSICNGGVK